MTGFWVFQIDIYSITGEAPVILNNSGVSVYSQDMMGHCKKEFGHGQKGKNTLAKAILEGGVYE
jgi:hypothetical protein